MRGRPRPSSRAHSSLVWVSAGSRCLGHHLVSPDGVLLFSAAHFHHVIEQLRFRQGSVTGIFLSAGEQKCVSCRCGTVFLSAEPMILLLVFQFSYTAVFGAYTAFIFIRTGENPHRCTHFSQLLRCHHLNLNAVPGHLIGPVLCHSFCNYMGFPAISTAMEHPHRLTILSSYLLGVVLFLLLLFPFTDPSFYAAVTPVCSLSPSPSPLCLS